MQPKPLKTEQALDQEILVLRAKILEIAAALDRLDRGEGDVSADARMNLLHRAFTELSSEKQGRAERVQLLFSLPYDEDWRRMLD